MSDLRKVEKKVDDSWVQCRLSEIKKGDFFRIYEVDGTLLEFSNGPVYLALADPCLNKHGNWEVDGEGMTLYFNGKQYP